MVWTNETCVWEQQVKLKDRVHPTPELSGKSNK